MKILHYYLIAALITTLLKAWGVVSWSWAVVLIWLWLPMIIIGVLVTFGVTALIIHHIKNDHTIQKSEEQR